MKYRSHSVIKCDNCKLPTKRRSKSFRGNSDRDNSIQVGNNKNNTKIGLLLFECDDTVYRLISEFEIEEVKKLRLICKLASKKLMEIWIKDHCFFKLSARDIIDYASCKLLTETVEEIVHKFNFILLNASLVKLSFSKMELVEFRKFLSNEGYKEKRDSFLNMFQKINVCQIEYLDTDKDIGNFKNLLEVINTQSNLFPKLKCLQTTEYADLNFKLPDFIECFDSRFNSDPSLIKLFYNQTHRVNICDQPNLKYINIDFLKSFKIGNLPQLQSIKINFIYCHHIEINTKEFMNLKSVIFYNKEKFDNCEKISIDGDFTFNGQ